MNKRENAGENQSHSGAKKYGLHWMKINTPFYWQVNLYQARIGEELIKGQDSMMFNTGASLSYIPKP